ncbi:MAG: trigger factor [Pseudomonadota bacterium]|nr:trigger factor [Pseudomonadota bacterium]
METTSGLGRRMTVQVPSERIGSEVDKRLKELITKVRIPGFRPGKVPLRLVRQRYGGQVFHEVADELIRSSFQEAVTQEKLNPVSPPQIKPGPIDKEKAFEYTADFEVYPQIEVASMERAEIRRPTAEVTDTDVDRMIEQLRTQRRAWESVDRAAEEGDRVTLDFEGSIGDEVFEGGTGKDMAVEIGAGRMLPDFERNLPGTREGDEKDFDVNFPDDYRNEALAGKPARFSIKVSHVERSVLPEVDEEFVRAFGVADGDLEKFRTNVRSNMERELGEKVKARVKQQVMDALLDRNPFEIPGALVAEETERLRRQTMEMIGAKDPKAFPDERFGDTARRRVSLGLVIGEIVKQQGFRADEASINQAVDAIVSSYEDPAQVRQYYLQNPTARADVEASVLEDRVVDWVLAVANVTEDPVTFESFVNQPKTENAE